MFDALSQLAIILVVSFFLKELADKAKIPFIVLLILGGTSLATYGIIDVKSLTPLPEMIRTIALILVVFSSAFYLNIEELKKHSKSLVMLATIGVLLTALMITTTTLYLLPIPLITAAFLGVLLSGTDPAAISQALSKKESKVGELLRAESLFNSPVTVILPLLLLDFIAFPEDALLNVPKLFLLITIGIMIGAAGGVIGKKLLNQTKLEHSQTLGLAIAIATYVIAEQLLGSGIMAVAVCSILLNSGNFPRKTFLGEFNSELAFISTLFVFMLLGAQFQVSDLIFTRQEIIAVVLALILARMLTTLVVLFNSEFNLSEKIKIGLIAPKGVSPAALAPLVLIPAYGIIGAEIIVKITYVAIILSILISLIITRITVQPKTEEEKLQEELIEKKELREKKKIS
ncbi:MAG: cation:proton antiporter [archaeon]|nr:cation:proton antiporter [archaeon]